MSSWDPSFPSTSFSASQEAQESISGQTPSRKLKVTFLSSEWKSTKGGLSTINGELAIQLAKHQNVEVNMYLPQCSDEDVRIAGENNVKLIKAKELIGYEPIEWLSSAPENHEMDYVIGHGLILGQQVQLIQKQLPCKWVQVVHTAPEELGMFKGYANAISKSEKKHRAEVQLCELADQVVAVGPKLADEYSCYLRHCQRDQSVFVLTPSILSEFSRVEQAAEERMTFRVLVFGRSDNEDFELKGYDIAAKAISELNEESYKLIFAGAPLGKEEKVAEKLCQHGIAPRQLTVRSFKESREDLGKLFCEADLCLMPSRTEGFGLAALEALSAGLPILVSGNSGFGDALQKVPHGSSCVVNSEDPAEWAKAIKSVRKKSRDVRLEETADLRAQYAKKYCWKEQCDELVKRMSDSIFGSTHATESGRDSSLTRRYLLSTVVSEAYVEPTRAGIDCTDKNGKRPLHPSDTPPSKKQRHDTDTCRVGVAERQAAENLEKTASLHICEAAIADTAVVRKLLTQDYKRRAEFSPLLWSKAMKLHLDEVYTRLKIVSRPKRIVHPASLEIDLGNIFSCEGDVSMALAEGSPGIGKTTLCLKLAYDWANESMPSTFPIFELVLLLKCRDLDGDIMEAISEQLLPDDIAVKTKEGLLNFITDLVNQKRILIILDGLDELPEKSQHHVSKLLKRSILLFCYVLTTTRQEKGIEARKQFAFDICVQIEGFTEQDSFEYIRKHFKNIDPSKGERLIEETKENTFLHALQKNPLNLLLLCVVYEDHEGKLPSSRTDLYQIIVRCLLRRYCEKNSVKACEEDSDLEKQFEANILVLGELAWECLLNDRHSFREDELTKLERSDDKLVVRYLSLVFKEESLKRLKPNHEYFFLHKSFQEYMAAFYIAHKLRRNQFKVFKRLSFSRLVIKFPQVFLFVCGILRKEAIILFTQIGEKLKSNWDWLQCDAEETRFFLESFSESGKPEQMAYTLFSFLPFPRVLQLFIDPDEFSHYVGGDLVRLLSICTGIPEVPKPAEVHLKIKTSWDFTVFTELASLPNVTSLYFLADKYIFREPQFFEEISNFTSLSELTLPSAVEWEIVGEYLRTNKTLEKLTFALFDESDDGWAKALDAGLCADTPLSTVGVRIHGSLSPSALQALENLLFNKFLACISLFIYGDMKDSLAVVLARGFTGEMAVKVVDLCVSGKLSLHGAKLIERGIVGNNSRTKLIVSLRGEVPDNWQAVGNNLHSRFGQKTPALITIHPNTFSKVTASQVAHFRPFGIMGGSRVRQNVTLNVWGELGGDGAEALFEGLSRKHVSHLTLDIHGKLTDDILNSTARWVEERNTQSSLTINTWEQLTKEEKNLFEELKLDKNPAVTPNVRDVPAPPGESRDNEFVSIDNLDSLIALFKEAKNTRKHNLSAKISIESDDEAEECNVLPGKEILKNSDLGNGVHAGVASNSNFSREPNVHAPPEESRDDEFVSIHDLKSLIALFKEAKNTGKDDDEDKDDDDDEDDDGEDDDGEDDDDDDDDGEDDDDGDDDDDDAEGCNGNLLDLSRKETLKNSDLGNGVDVGAASNTSFIAPTPLNINYTSLSREPEDGLDHVLASNTTLNDLRLTYDNDDDDMSYSWALPSGDGLARNTSLKNLTLAIHYYKEKSGKWRESLGSGLERNTSLKNLTVVMENNANEVVGELGIDWARSTSVENLLLTVNSDSIVWDSWTGGPGSTGEELARKKSLKSLTLTINNFGELTLYWEVDKSWENNSLNDFSLTINNYGNIRPRSCFEGFFFQFKSLTTFNLTLNLCGKPGEDILYGLLEEAVKSQSLKTLRLKVNDSQITNGRRRYDFSRYVVTSPSLSLLEVTVTFYSVEKSSRE
ncbi:uncharacterized protein [Montipora foliosa]|uniref:uncharacterized protein isoform X2 n=1 Tax=Montipora foliosa TaxID=591990 RepID=UPI0035F1052B